MTAKNSSILLFLLRGWDKLDESTQLAAASPRGGKKKWETETPRNFPSLHFDASVASYLPPRVFFFLFSFQAAWTCLAQLTEYLPTFARFGTLPAVDSWVDSWVVPSLRAQPPLTRPPALPIFAFPSTSALIRPSPMKIVRKIQ